MPRRIGAKTDMDILTDLGMGMERKEVAEKYDVSISYISKLSRGKKVPEVYIPEVSRIVDNDIEAFEQDITDISALIQTKNVLVAQTDLVKYLKAQVQRSVIRAKIYLELLKKYEGE